MKNNTKALLVVSFGTTFNTTREKTLDRIENDLAAAFPDRRFYRAWTSTTIRKKLALRDHVQIDSVAEAFDRMAEDGITDFYVQPSYVIPGLEFDKVRKLCQEAGQTGRFAQIQLGLPLLSSASDIRQTAEIVAAWFASKAGCTDDSALLLMGHGTEGGAQLVYSDMQQAFARLGQDHIFLATVEGQEEAAPYLTFSSALQKIKAYGPKTVYLVPFMIVAGDHATNDLDGPDQDSWKSLLQAEGFETISFLNGLGENPDIRRIFLTHALDASAI